MNKKRKLLSLVTALAITASAFTGFVIPANAENETTDVETSVVTMAGESSVVTHAYAPTATGTLAAGVIEENDVWKLENIYEVTIGTAPSGAATAINGFTVPFRIKSDISAHVETWDSTNVESGKTAFKLTAKKSGTLKVYVSGSAGNRGINLWDNTTNTRATYSKEIEKDGVIDAVFDVVEGHEYYLYARGFTGSLLKVEFTNEPSVEIEKATATVNKGSTVTLNAKIINKGDAEVEWTSSEPTVATVDNGVVTGVAVGESTITAKVTVGGTVYSDTCVVTVVDVRTATFTVGESGAAGTAPAAQTVATGTKTTMPANRTLYKEGFTLTAWTDGTNEYTVGSEVTLNENITLTPVFTANTKAPVGEVTFDFQKQNGAPEFEVQGANIFIVGQAVVDGTNVDVKLDIDTTNGKFNNKGWNDWAQVNTGTKMSVAVTAGSVVKVNTIMGSDGVYTINGVSKTGSDKQETIAADGTCEIVVGNPSGGYWKGITVTYAAPAATEAPTAAPTEAPTAAPTEAPTAAPTEAPTGAPTATEAPTAAPTEAPTEAPAATKTPVTPGQNNSINISENFDSDVVNGEGYTWDVETTNIFGNKGSGAADTVLTGNALSLSDNANKNILTFNQGVGGTQKDIEFTFDAGTVKGFGQANVTWEMVFKSTDGIEMFKIRFVSGNWSRTVSLVVGDKVQTTNYAYGEKFVNSKCYIMFNDNGGVVTLGNVSAAFENASDLGTISVTYDNGNCYSRPFVVDNFVIKTVDKEKVTFTVASSEAGQSVEGAELTIGDDVYTVPASGKVEAYYLPGDYTYELKLAKHKAVSGTLNVIKAGGQKEVYEFNNIASDITEATLIEAAYTVTATPQLSSIKSSTVTITDGKYSFEKDVPTEPVVGTETKYFLWNSLEGMKPLSTVEKTVVELNNDKNITLEYVGDPKPAKIEIAGGDEYIYLPTTGTASSKAFTATVYDQAELVMDSAEVEWSLPGQPSTISIGSDGVVTLTPDYSLTDDNGVDVTVRATVKGTTVTADTSIHIHNTARATSWDIVGPAVIKDGTAATYSVANIFLVILSS